MEEKKGEKKKKTDKVESLHLTFHLLGLQIKVIFIFMQLHIHETRF